MIKESTTEEKQKSWYYGPSFEITWFSFCIITSAAKDQTLQNLGWDRLKGKDKMITFIISSSSKTFTFNTSVADLCHSSTNRLENVFPSPHFSRFSPSSNPSFHCSLDQLLPLCPMQACVLNRIHRKLLFWNSVLH